MTAVATRSLVAATSRVELTHVGHTIVREPLAFDLGGGHRVDAPQRPGGVPRPTPPLLVSSFRSVVRGAWMSMKRGGDQPESEATRLADKSTAAFEDAVQATSPIEQVAQLEVAQDAAGDSALAGAYIFLQKLIGCIAVALPFVVAIGNLALGEDELESSISAYYYTPVGNVFVGALCALGVFFLSYQHKPLPGYVLDNRLSYGASAAVIGVALFPTAEHEAEPWTGEWLVSTTHLVCACVLFLLLAYFSLRLFTKTDQGRPMSDQKRRRNVVFKVCGWTIVGSIALVIITNIVDPPKSWDSLFWLESVGVIAFGVSWLVKSGIRGILVDRATTAPVAVATARPMDSR